jgi:hypothetical protein
MPWGNAQLGAELCNLVVLPHLEALGASAGTPHSQAMAGWYHCSFHGLDLTVPILVQRDILTSVGHATGGLAMSARISKDLGT